MYSVLSKAIVGRVLAVGSVLGWCTYASAEGGRPFDFLINSRFSKSVGRGPRTLRNCLPLSAFLTVPSQR